MGTINRIVRGLLSTIDSQVQGKHPDSFGEQIVPIYEMKTGLQWTKGVVIKTNAAAATGNGKVVDLQPAPGELWQVHAVGVDFVALDDLITNWNIGLRFSSNSIDVPIIPVQLAAFNVSMGMRTGTGVVFPIPWEITQGYQFSAWVDRVSGAAPVAGVSVLLRVVCTVQLI